MKDLAVVATLRAFPERRLNRGQVGTVVEKFDGGYVLVDFADINGVTHALVPVPEDQLIELKHTPQS